MSDTIKLEFNAYALQRALRARFEYSARGWESVFKDSMKAFSKKLMQVTPPGNGNAAETNVSFPKLKKIGQNAIAADLSRVFATRRDDLQDPLSKQSKKKNSHLPIMRAVHKQARQKNGRVSKNAKPTLLVTAKLLREYTKKRQEHVGYLSAGWVAAAKQFGTNVPDWIARHSASSSVIFRSSKTVGDFYFEATNGVKFAGNVWSLQKYIAKAMSVQAKKIENQVRGYQIAYYSGQL
jgi:hypothetical protein